MNTIRASNIEVDEDYRVRYSLTRNFTIMHPFKIQHFSDSWLTLFPKEKNNTRLIESNRSWTQDSNNIYNLRRLCKELLLPINQFCDDSINIICGVVNDEVRKKMGLPSYSQLRFGKAVILKTYNTFDTWLKILQSELAFSECIYFSEKDCVYIGLPNEVLKNIVKIK